MLVAGGKLGVSPDGLNDFAVYACENPCGARGPGWNDVSRRNLDRRQEKPHRTAWSIGIPQSLVSAACGVGRRHEQNGQTCSGFR